jgi:hypothetical protein
VKAVDEKPFERKREAHKVRIARYLVMKTILRLSTDLSVKRSNLRSISDWILAAPPPFPSTHEIFARKREKFKLQDLFDPFNWGENVNGRSKRKRVFLCQLFCCDSSAKPEKKMMKEGDQGNCVDVCLGGRLGVMLLDRTTHKQSLVHKINISMYWKTVTTE